MPRTSHPKRKPIPGSSKPAGKAKGKAGNNPGSLRLYLLDVGTQQYGDCILAELGERHILIDGAHPVDFRGTTGHQSIPSQLESIFKHPAPFPIDLLVATHCHLDHIGCLPDLVANDLQVKRALVADETMGFPTPDNMGGDAAENPAYRLVAALTEENYTDGLDDAGVNQFLQDAARLQDRYSEMLEQLEKQGGLIRYGGLETPGLTELEEEFSDFGLSVLGPTLNQLEICRDYLKQSTQDIADQVTSVADAARPDSHVALYREMTRRAADLSAEDRPGPGAAKNDQSIVIKLSVGGHNALLTGDMQFAIAEVPDLDNEMSKLLDVVDKNGPYTFIKLAHHGSYNGLNGDIFKDWNKTVAYACSSGTNDTSHPNSQVLSLLKSDADEIEWGRTDKNGLVTVTFDADKPSMEVARGKLNDSSPAAGARTRDDVAEASAASALTLTPVTASAGGMTEFGATLQVGGTTLTLSLKTYAEVKAPQPPRISSPLSSSGGGKVVDARPLPQPGTLPPIDFAGKRKLPKLLFVTGTQKFIENIGNEETQAALRAIRDAGQTVLEISDTKNPFPEIHAAFEKSDYAGVVILGGYDVLPAQRLDVLDPDLRAAIGRQAAKDGDNFVVWSDEAYGDLNSDGFAEVPVTRIPDAKSSRLVFVALGATNGAGTITRFGIRNDARPFAEQIYPLLQGDSALLVSHPCSPDTVGAAAVRQNGIYLMLHGSEIDGTRFWGELDEGLFEAVRISNLARGFPSVVFSGCCWGALTVDRIANQARAGDPLPVRTVESSMALTFLQAGAMAFIGCTGSHYSPLQSPFQYYGGPMHEAFWKRYNESSSPAESSHHAKQDFEAGFPHSRDTAIGRAIELKVLREYTCLGLGW